MNYIKEINAFYDWLELNSVKPSAVILWHTLMHLNNKAGWIQEFTVARSVIEAKTGLKKDAYYNARNQLKQLGRLEFKERGNKATVFMLIPFVPSEKQTTTQTIIQTTTPTVSPTVTPTFNKLKETKQNKTKKEDEEGALQNPFRFFEENGFGLISPHISENISLWIDDLSEILVIEAMKIAIEQGVRTWKYVESILRDWSKKRLKTVEQVKADQLAYRESKSRKGNAYSRKPVRQELLPDFMKSKELPETEQAEQDVVSFEEKKRLFEERLKQQKNG